MIKDFPGYLKVRLVKPEIERTSSSDLESDPKFKHFLTIIYGYSGPFWWKYNSFRKSKMRFHDGLARLCYILIVQMHLVCSPGPLILIKNAISSSQVSGEPF